MRVSLGNRDMHAITSSFRNNRMEFQYLHSKCQKREEHEHMTPPRAVAIDAAN